jgi:hypothetical protein
MVEVVSPRADSVMLQPFLPSHTLLTLLVMSMLGQVSLVNTAMQRVVELLP